MELVSLAKKYGDFYAPAYAVRLGRTDLMRDLLVAVSQVEVDMALGVASHFSFTVTDSYSHKLRTFQTGRGVRGRDRLNTALREIQRLPKASRG